jgi:hypothetical protein
MPPSPASFRNDPASDTPGVPEEGERPAGGEQAAPAAASSPRMEVIDPTPSPAAGETPAPAGPTPTAASPPGEARSVGASGRDRVGSTNDILQNRADIQQIGDNNTSKTINKSSSFNYFGGHERISLENFAWAKDHADRAAAELIAPHIFQEREELYERWLLAIVGPEASGRAAAAVWFANELQKRSLVDKVYVVEDNSLEKHYVLAQAPPGTRRLFVVKNVLAKRDKSLVGQLLQSRGDLGALRELRDTLRGSRLLITITLERLNELLAHEIIDASEYQDCFVRDYSPRPRSSVLRHHLKRCFRNVPGGEQQIEKIIAELGPNLESDLINAGLMPPKMSEIADRLYNNIAQSASGSDENHSTARQAFERCIRDFGSIATEIKSFLTELPSDEDRIRAIQLSFIEGCAESEFWRLSSLLQPERPLRRRPKEWFVETATVIQGRLRAKLINSDRLSDRERGQPSLRFRSENYAPAIRRYAKKEFPDLVRGLFDRLVAEMPGDPGLRQASVGPRALGLMAQIDWPSTRALVESWLNASTGNDWHNLAAPTVAAACLSADARASADALLSYWQEGGDGNEGKRERYLAAAAAAYRHLGSRQFTRAVEGLHEIARQLDLSPLALILPFDARLPQTDSADADYSEAWSYLVQQSEVTPYDDRDQVERKAQRYLDRISNGRERWGKLKVALEAVEYALLSLALFDGQMEQVARVLCDWLNEPERKNEHTIRLTASLVTWRLLQYLATQTDKPSRKPDPVLALLESDAEMIDVFGELFAGAIDRLHGLPLSGARRMSGRLCVALEEWCRPLADNHSATLARLLRNLLHHLRKAQAPAAKYTESLLTREWRSPRKPKSIQDLAQVVLS